MQVGVPEKKSFLFYFKIFLILATDNYHYIFFIKIYIYFQSYQQKNMKTLKPNYYE